MITVKDQVAAVEAQCEELRHMKKYLEALNKDTAYQKEVQYSIETEQKLTAEFRLLTDEIRVQKSKYRELDKSVRGFEGRAKSEDHRKEVLKAHYQMQQLKNTLASIKANRYLP
jgi:hypothetical protein